MIFIINSYFITCFDAMGSSFTYFLTNFPLIAPKRGTSTIIRFSFEFILLEEIDLPILCIGYKRNGKTCIRIYRTAKKQKQRKATV